MFIYIGSGSGEHGVAVLQRQVAELRAALTEAEEGKRRALEVLSLLTLLVQKYKY
jgi:hypothetical protein